MTAIVPYTGEVRATIREPGRKDVVSRPLPNSDAALQWAYGYMGLRGGPTNPTQYGYRDGTTVHIGSKIYILAGRYLRPLGNRRVIGQAQTGPLVSV